MRLYLRIARLIRLDLRAGSRELAGHIAASTATLLAIAMLNLAVRDAYYTFADPPRLLSGEVARWTPGLQPSWIYPDVWRTASHGVFHILQSSGMAIMAGVLVLFLAWGPLRQGQPWSFWALLVGGIPPVALTLTAEALFGPWHREALPVLILWILTVSSAAICIGLQRPRSSSHS